MAGKSKSRPVVSLGEWTPRTPEEDAEIEQLCSINEWFKATKEIVEEAMAYQARIPGQEEFGNFVFKLNNADYNYRIQDLPLIADSLLQGTVKFQVTKFKSIAEVIVMPQGEMFQARKELTCRKINDWMNSKTRRELKALRVDEAIHTDDLCIVQWPKVWLEVCSLMESVNGEKWWDDNLQNLGMNIFQEDFFEHTGKWFRASCVRSFGEKQEIYEMFLVDLGISTLIPAKNLYKIPHRLMLDYQASLVLNVRLEGLTQCNEKVDEKWKYLLLPGMTIKAKVLWMFDEINIVQLIEPSEKEFDNHFNSRFVTDAIDTLEHNNWRRDVERRARKKAVVKGTYQRELDKILEEEKTMESEKQSKAEYLGIERVHPDRVFKFRLPNLHHDKKGNEDEPIRRCMGRGRGRSFVHN